MHVISKCMPPKSSTPEFIVKARAVHGDRYDYSNVVYINANEKVVLHCSLHGPFTQNPRNHLRGAGCPHCGSTQRGKSITKTTDTFVNRAQIVHNNKYDYSLSDYQTAHDFVTITCPTHGVFTQKAFSHLNGAGCPSCKCVSISTKKRSTATAFITKAVGVHGSVYDYSKVVYVTNSVPVIVGCPLHGEFMVRPNDHLTKKSGCPKCYNFSSAPEILWLDSLNIPEDDRQVVIFVDGIRYKVDGIDRQTNTVYEFLGDFWHGNPDKFDGASINPITKTTYGELYGRYLLKKQHLMSAGYNVVDIWEQQWYNQ